jgi:predicted metal-binding protein
MSGDEVTAYTELLVCTTCRQPGTPRDAPADGQHLFEAVQALLAFEPPPGVHLRGIACLAACSRSCSAALQAAGKHTYVFGDLPPDGTSAEQLLCVAQQHLRLADGVLPWGERPERLKRGVLTRLPPLSGGAET